MTTRYPCIFMFSTVIGFDDCWHFTNKFLLIAFDEHHCTPSVQKNLAEIIESFANLYNQEKYISI